MVAVDFEVMCSPTSMVRPSQNDGCLSGLWNPVTRTNVLISKNVIDTSMVPAVHRARSKEFTNISPLLTVVLYLSHGTDGKPRHRKVTSLSRGHSASRWRTWSCLVGGLASGPLERRGCGPRVLYLLSPWTSGPLLTLASPPTSTPSEHSWKASWR